MLITKENLYTLVKLANTHKNTEGIEFIQVAPDHMSTDGGKFWNSDVVKSEINAAEKILKQRKIDLITSGFEILSTSYENVKEMIDIPKRCYAHFYQISIMADGNVAFCKNSRFKPEYQIGNINQNKISINLSRNVTDASARITVKNSFLTSM